MKLEQIMEKTKTELDRFPEDVIKDLQKRIREGAEDLTQKWANALELVHKAFEVEGVERPSPSHRNAWKQYEELIKYAVEQLAETRGMDSDWRMSSHVFRD